LHRVGVGLKLAQEDGDGRRETEKKARHRGRRDDAPLLLAIHYRLSSFSITQHRHNVGLRCKESLPYYSLLVLTRRTRTQRNAAAQKQASSRQSRPRALLLVFCFDLALESALLLNVLCVCVVSRKDISTTHFLLEKLTTNMRETSLKQRAFARERDMHRRHGSKRIVEDEYY